MIDFDRAVLYVGIAAVLGVATFNHMHANAAQPLSAPVELSGALSNAAVAEPTRAPALPRGYWTNAETTPLQGVGQGLIRAADPTPHPGVEIVPVRAQPMAQPVVAAPASMACLATADTGC